jgi:photosystem II stability/assembly factor-like uncharacterized protein
LPTKAKDRIASHQPPFYQVDNSNYSNYPVENIGPTIMSGRVSDIEVNPENPFEFYVAYASGGLWYTNNNGTSFSPVFDQESVITIGDFDVDWANNHIYLGTGEVNSSRSSYAGNGMYKSINGGKTWSHIGLPESHHIGRVVVDASDVNTIWVAALGHLYSPNTERGIYMTTDGGKTWNQTLYINENTGAIDLVQDQLHPNVLYAAVWHRERRAWNFVESGEGSGIYKSVDSGKTWTKLSTEESGFPTGEGIGRIGLDLSYEGDKTTLYVLLDNYNRRPRDEESSSDKLTKAELKTMSNDDLIALPDSILSHFLESNNFPKKYDAKEVKKLIQQKEVSALDLAIYLEDANALLFDTDVVGAEVYKSEDGGIKFNKTHQGYIDRLYNSYGYYFGQIRAEKDNPNTIYILGVPILRSDDGGVTWDNINGDNVHVDHHDLWINPSNPNHIVNGNDGGVNISYDKGDHWIKCNTPSVGQFYYINVDQESPYNVYVGAQDNGVWVGPSNYKPNTSWHQYGQYPYKSLLGGDGMQIQIDNRNSDIVYTGFQFGNYFRIDRSTGKRQYITPKHKLGDRPYRWNWQSPILLSPHNQDILYMGSNKVLRSMNQGETFEEISDDLTKGGQKGDVAYGTIVGLDESIFKFGKLVVGTDDGRIHLSEDGGNSWNEIGKNLPPHLWVSRVQFSKHNDQTIYAALNGYRWDDFTPYLYKTTDNGKSWTSISSTLPLDPINVIKEDPIDGDILYVGTDFGLFISTNKGGVFHPFATDIPNVPIHDVVVQQPSDDLLVATHGRSVYKINLQYLRSIKDSNKVCQLFVDESINYRENWGTRSAVYEEWRQPILEIKVFSPNDQKSHYKITTENGVILHEKNIQLKKGMNSFDYHLTIDKRHQNGYKKENKDHTKTKENNQMYLDKGIYSIELIDNGKTIQQTFKVK